LSYLINESCEVSILDFSLDVIDEYQLNISAQEIIANQGDLITITLDVFSDSPLTDYSTSWIINNDYYCEIEPFDNACLSVEVVANFSEIITVTFTDQQGCVSDFAVDL